MTPRSIGSLTISCALVSIPVKLYSAVDSTAAIEFKLMTPSGSRVRQTHQDAQGEAIEPQDMVRGYEYARDAYVTFTRAELQALDEPTTHQVDVKEFVPVDSIDPSYFDKAYILAPDRGGARGYSLICAALRKTGRTAIGHWASRGRDHLVAIRAVGERLVMQQLRWSEDMRPVSAVPCVAEKHSAQELALAVQLIESAATTFDATAHPDNYRTRVRKAIETKISALPKDPQPQQDGKVIDLMAALQASVRKSKVTKPTKRTQRARA